MSWSTVANEGSGQAKLPAPSRIVRPSSVKQRAKLPYSLDSMNAADLIDTH